MSTSSPSRSTSRLRVATVASAERDVRSKSTDTAADLGQPGQPGRKRTHAPSTTRTRSPPTPSTRLRLRGLGSVANPGAARSINPENVFVLGFKGPACSPVPTDGGQRWEPAQDLRPGREQPDHRQPDRRAPRRHPPERVQRDPEFQEQRQTGDKFDFNLSCSAPRPGCHMEPRAARSARARSQSMALFRPSASDPDALPPARGFARRPPLRRRGRSDATATSTPSGRTHASVAFRHDEIAFSMSTDGGFTWSAPIKINQTPTNIPVGQPAGVHAHGVRLRRRHDRGHLLRFSQHTTPDPATLPTDYLLASCTATSRPPCPAPIPAKLGR